MIVDPKTNSGDIVASVHSRPASERTVAGRFEGVSEYDIHSYILPLIQRLKDDGLLVEKNGKLYATKEGKLYIAEMGYFD